MTSFWRHFVGSQQPQSWRRPCLLGIVRRLQLRWRLWFESCCVFVVEWACGLLSCRRPWCWCSTDRWSPPSGRRAFLTGQQHPTWPSWSSTRGTRSGCCCSTEPHISMVTCTQPSPAPFYSHSSDTNGYRQNCSSLLTRHSTAWVTVLLFIIKWEWEWWSTELKKPMRKIFKAGWHMFDLI